MGDRQMSVLPVTLSLLASFISAITLLGTPSEVFLNGTQYSLLAFANIAVIPVAAYVYIPVFYPLRLTSAYEYLELRFNKASRNLSTIIFAVMMTMYLAIVLYSPCLALSSLTDINLWLLVVVAGASCVFYTTLGGMKAVMWTDAFQVSIMYLGITLILLLGSYHQEGGFTGAWRMASSRGRIEFDNINPHPFERHTVWSVLIGGFFTWLAVYGVNQAQVQRCLSSPSLRKAQLALWLNAPGLFFFVMLTSLLGILIFGHYGDCDPLLANIINAKDQLLPLFVMDVMSPYPGLAGLFISCVFCGSLSTISSGLNSLSAVIMQDFVLVYFCPSMSDGAAANLSKVLVAAFGALVMGLTWVASMMGGILAAALALFGAIGGPLLGVFTLGIFVPFANSFGAILGLFTALAVSLWITVGAHIYKPPSTFFCKSTTHCDEFTEDIVFNVSAVPYVTCDQPRIPVPDLVSYEGLSIYRISYLWYSVLSVAIVLFVGIFASLLTGRRNWGSPSSKFVHPIMRRFTKGTPPPEPTGNHRKEEEEERELGQRSNAGYEHDMRNMGPGNFEGDAEAGEIGETKY